MIFQMAEAHNDIGDGTASLIKLIANLLYTPSNRKPKEAVVTF
jgi:hypothetical protein